MNVTLKIENIEHEKQPEKVKQVRLGYDFLLHYVLYL